MIFTKKEKNIILYISGFILVGGFWILFNKNYLKKTPKNINRDIEAYNENILTVDESNDNLKEETVISEEKNQNDYNENNIVAKSDRKININTGNTEELIKIPYIGENKAKKIIVYRKKNGKFEKVEDLMKVKGIGKKTFEKIKELIDI